MYMGNWNHDDFLTFAVVTKGRQGALKDADSVPTYRVYEDETATPISSGSMAKLDDANTTGFYTQRIQLTASTGYERGKTYNIYIEATVDNIVTGTLRSFQVGGAGHQTIVHGRVDTASFSPTTTQFECDNITEATADHYKDRVVIWKTGVLTDQAKDITAYSLVGGKGRFTVTAMTEAPGDNDTFLIY